MREWINLFETDLVSIGSYTADDAARSESLARSQNGRNRLSRLTRKYMDWFNGLSDEMVVKVGCSLVEYVEVGDEVDISPDEFEAILNRTASVDAAMARRCGNEVLRAAIAQPAQWPCVCGTALRWWLSREK